MGGAHGWYEEVIVHNGWNKFIETTGLPAELGAEVHAHEGSGDFIPERFVPWLLISLVGIPIIWNYIKNKYKKGGENGEGPSMRNES